MIQTIFYFFASFIGIYINMWLLLQIFEKKSQFLKRKMTKKLPKVSVLIPACNEEASIEEALDSVLGLDYPKNKVEVIVIDNGSTDNTSKIVQKFKNVKLIKQKKPCKATALNNGLKLATGKLIGILDADTLVTKDCLKKTVGYFDDPKVGAVTNLIDIDTKKGFLAKMQNIEYLFSALTKRVLSLLGSMYVTPGTLSLIREDIARNIGFSDDTLTEDMDIALSILKRGYKIVNSLDAVVYTKIPMNFKKLTEQRIRWYRGFIENSLKHRDILFNKKSSHLGYFIIPISFIAIFIGVLVSIASFNQFVNDITLFSRSILYISLSDQASLFLIGIPNLISSLLSSYLFIFFIFVFSTSFAVLYFSLKFFGRANRINTILLPVYMLGYYFLIMVYWAFALFQELFRWRKKW